MQTGVSAFIAEGEEILVLFVLHLNTFFENQMTPMGTHNLSKKIWANLATVCVLSLRMTFNPKSDVSNWKQVF